MLVNSQAASLWNRPSSLPVPVPRFKSKIPNHFPNGFTFDSDLEYESNFVMLIKERQVTLVSIFSLQKTYLLCAF